MCGARVVLLPSYEPIVLRSEDKVIQPYQDTPATLRMRRNLVGINGALSSSHIAHPALGIIRPGDPTRFEYVDKETGEIRHTQSGPADMTLFRVFAGGFHLHGRFYGPFWQQWPEQERAQLTIDGGRVVEEDYASLHPRLLYLERGLEPLQDPYDIPGIRRAVAKIALLVMINAQTRRDALVSLKRRDWNMETPPLAAEIDATVRALEEVHRPIADAFHSDSGIRLMWHDARMAEKVMLDLQDQNIVALPVHDSFVVRAEFRQHLLAAMENALNATLKVSTRQQRATTKALEERKRDGRGTTVGHMWNRKQYVEPNRVSALIGKEKTGVAKVFATKAA
jgi:hypothetical protein